MKRGGEEGQRVEEIGRETGEGKGKRESEKSIPVTRIGWCRVVMDLGLRKGLWRQGMCL